METLISRDNQETLDGEPMEQRHHTSEEGPAVSYQVVTRSRDKFHTISEMPDGNKQHETDQVVANSSGSSQQQYAELGYTPSSQRQQDAGSSYSTVGAPGSQATNAASLIGVYEQLNNSPSPSPRLQSHSNRGLALTAKVVSAGQVREKPRGHFKRHTSAGKSKQDYAHLNREWQQGSPPTANRRHHSGKSDSSLVTSHPAPTGKQYQQLSRLDEHQRATNHPGSEDSKLVVGNPHPFHPTNKTPPPPPLLSPYKSAATSPYSLSGDSMLENKVYGKIDSQSQATEVNEQSASQSHTKGPSIITPYSQISITEIDGRKESVNSGPPKFSISLSPSVKSSPDGANGCHNFENDIYASDSSQEMDPGGPKVVGKSNIKGSGPTVIAPYSQVSNIEIDSRKESVGSVAPKFSISGNQHPPHYEHGPDFEMESRKFKKDIYASDSSQETESDNKNTVSQSSIKGVKRPSVIAPYSQVSNTEIDNRKESVGSGRPRFSVSGSEPPPYTESVRSGSKFSFSGNEPTPYSEPIRNSSDLLANSYRSDKETESIRSGSKALLSGNTSRSTPNILTNSHRSGRDVRSGSKFSLPGNAPTPYSEPIRSSPDLLMNSRKSVGGFNTRDNSSQVVDTGNKGKSNIKKPNIIEPYSQVSFLEIDGRKESFVSGHGVPRFSTSESELTPSIASTKSSPRYSFSGKEPLPYSRSSQDSLAEKKAEQAGPEFSISGKEPSPYLEPVTSSSDLTKIDRHRVKDGSKTGNSDSGVSRPSISAREPPSPYSEPVTSSPEIDGHRSRVEDSIAKESRKMEKKVRGTSSRVPRPRK